MRKIFLILLCVSFIPAASFAQTTDIDPDAAFEPVLTDSLMQKIFGPVDLETLTGDNQLLGCEGVYYEFWITGGNSGSNPNKLYKLREYLGTWTLVAAYDQPPHCTGLGWRDLAYSPDDGYLYGSSNSNLDQIDPATGQWTGYSIPGPENPNRALAYDPATDHFWIANFASDIYEIDRTGYVFSSWPNSYSIYGMAWDAECGINGPRLFVHSQDGNGMLVSEFIDGYTGQTWDVTENSGVAGGAAAIVHIWERGPVITLTVLGQGEPDFISGYELCCIPCAPDTNFRCSLEIISSVVPSVNGDIFFNVSIRNYSSMPLPVWAEIYPTIGDCINGNVIENFDLQKRLSDFLWPGETINGQYFYHVNDVSRMNLSLCAITLDIGTAPDLYLPWARECDEFLFYNPWGRTGGDVVWGDDWYPVDENIPTANAIGQNYPNPFNAATTIPFDLDKDADVSLRVYNLNGRLVETLIDGRMSAGHHTIDWDASVLSSGVYFYKLTVGDKIITKRMILLK